MTKNKMLKSKRFKITSLALLANVLIMVLGILSETNLIELGTGLAMINAPLYGYIWGETLRPSGVKKDKSYSEIKD